jgi:hypothetical protein
VNLAHAGGKIGDFETFLIEHIGIATAAGGGGFDFETQVLRRLADKPHDPGIVGNVHAVVVALDLGLDSGVKLPSVDIQQILTCRFLETTQHVLRLLFQFVLMVASRFTFERDQIGYNVDGHPSFNNAYVGRCFVVNPAQVHPRDPLSGEVAAIEMRPRSPLVVGLDWQF